ncbi:MAG: hypothetical protein ABIG44_05785 [Planctomycetota bacterium]
MVATLCLSAWAQARAIDLPITYQGQLKLAGEPVTNAVDFRFSLWDADVFGTQVGTDFTPAAPIDVVDGLFTAQIDTMNFGPTAFNGDPRWLEIEVWQDGTGWVTLSPRQMLTASPFALYAFDSPGGGGECLWSENGSDIYYNTGEVGVGTSTPGYRLHVLDNSSYPAAVIRNDGAGEGLRAESVGGTAILAASDYRGITAWAHNPGAFGIFAGSDAAYGAGAGVYGYCTSIEGSGVSGYAAAGSGNASGLYGVTDSTGGFGVWGVANSTSGLAEGGRFTTNASMGRGVYARCNATSGTNYGVYGRADSTSGRAVYGSATAVTGTTYGLYGSNVSTGPDSVAVRGEKTGGGYGGYFSSASGVAGKFQNTGSDCVVIDHNAEIFNTAALSVYSTGTEEPIGMEVTVDADFGQLATFDLNGATGYLGSAFQITADNSGNVVKIVGENTVSNEDVLRAESAGFGSAILGYNSRDGHDAPAVYGYHISDVGNYGIGVKGEGGYKGVEGRATGGDGTGTKFGVYGYVSGGSGTNYGVYGYAGGGATNYAGYFSGNLRCTGMLSKGGGTFMIDHPLDPENKYLYHSFVESPDMMNIYNGNVVLDGDGEAVVAMPEWFEALNMEFRYQLTCIGGFAQVYIAEEIADNQFKIAGGKPGLKVSWQVTGVRQDPFANANRVQVEVDKPESERGTYLHPEAWGVPAELQLDRVREAREVEDHAANID